MSKSCVGCKWLYKKDAGYSNSGLLRQLVLDCQNDLATYIVPDSGISEHDVVNTLLGRLDGPQSRAALSTPSATGSNERDTIIESCALAALNHPGGYSANLRIYIAESIRTLKSTPKVSAPADGRAKEKP